LHPANFQNGLISEEELKSAKFPSDVSECLHEYDGFDADADGCFTSPEMQTDTEKMEKMFGGGDTNASVFMDIHFKTQDTDQDGCLSQAERKEFCIRTSTPINDAFFEAGAFQLMDLNGDGKLSKEEYMEIDWQKVQDELVRLKKQTKPKQKKKYYK
jgi:Ca2+-binding EF-hand superfamily protein